MSWRTATSIDTAEESSLLPWRSHSASPGPKGAGSGEREWRCGVREEKQQEKDWNRRSGASRYSPLQLSKTVGEFYIPASYCGSRYKLFQLPEISLNLNSSTSPAGFK